MAKIISTSECQETIQEIIDSNHARPKNQKISNFENICEVLQKLGISVCKEPTETVRYTLGWV